MDDDSTPADRASAGVRRNRVQRLTADLIEALLGETPGFAVRVVLDDRFPRGPRAVDVLQIGERQPFAEVRLGYRVAVRIGANRRIARVDGFLIFLVRQV